MLLDNPHCMCSEGPMLSFLFRGLTAQEPRGAALFDALTAEARRPGWYVEGAGVDAPMRLEVLLEEHGTLIGRWLVERA